MTKPADVTPAAAAKRQRVRSMIQHAGVVMLINTDHDGSHVGRPMLPLWLEHDPSVYFLTHQSSRKVKQVDARPQVVLTIAGADCYVVVRGTASVLRDPALIRRLWNPTYLAWFPGGTDDREATVLRVTVEHVDYWEPPRSRLVRVGQALKALITRRAADTPMQSLDGL
jgi:general stress protein 26